MNTHFGVWGGYSCVLVNMAVSWLALGLCIQQITSLELGIQSVYYDAVSRRLY
jgi:hypothetical protein